MTLSQSARVHTRPQGLSGDRLQQPLSVQLETLKLELTFLRKEVALQLEPPLCVLLLLELKAAMIGSRIRGLRSARVERSRYKRHAK